MQILLAPASEADYTGSFMTDKNDIDPLAPQREAAMFYGLFLRGHSADTLRTRPQPKHTIAAAPVAFQHAHACPMPSHKKMVPPASMSPTMNTPATWAPGKFSFLPRPGGG